MEAPVVDAAAGFGDPQAVAAAAGFGEAAVFGEDVAGRDSTRSYTAPGRMEEIAIEAAAAAAAALEPLSRSEDSGDRQLPSSEEPEDHLPDLVSAHSAPPQALAVAIPGMPPSAGFLAGGVSPSAGSGGRPRTLADQDPDLAARALTFQKRLSKKRNRKDPTAFLSNLQETEDDVSYRFNFIVVGPLTEDVINGVCLARTSQRLGSATPSNSAGARCLCEVVMPMSEGKGPLVRKVAKLSMKAMTFDQDLPTWESRQEALSSCIVHVLWIDTVTQDGYSTFEDQLRGMEESLASFRAATKKKLRPVKAVLLLYQGGQACARNSLERWALSLSDWEHSNGDLWKFGPICSDDRESLHAAFAEMTSARLKHAQNAPEDPPEEAREPGEAEHELFQFKPSAGELLGSRGGMAMSDAASSMSEQELPPAFEAEASGSECSESALEMHRMVFGLDKDTPDSQNTSSESGGHYSSQETVQTPPYEADNVALLSPEAL